MGDAQLRLNRWTLGCIGVLALGFLTLDWSRLLLRPADLSASAVSTWLKVGLVFLATTLAWRSSGHGLDAGDEKRFRVIFSIILCADVLFAVGLPPVGILLFAAAHVLLVRRNLDGLGAARDKLRAAAPLLAAIGALAAAVIVVTVHWIYRMQGVTPLLVVIGVYVAMLWGSVTAAWAARFIGRYPPGNTLKMALGMTLFELCDVNVAANLALPVGDLTRVVTESLTWMFYGPALCLIALSAWKREPGSSALRHD